MFRKPLILSIISLLATIAPAYAQYIPVEPNPYGERALIVPVPGSVTGVKTPLLNLNDGWFSAAYPAEDFYMKTSLPDGFSPYTLDGTGWVNRETRNIAGFWRKVLVPQEFSGKRVILRFNSTAHDATLWVNGKFVRKHWGSYGSWTADITDFVQAGSDAVFAVKLDQRPVGLVPFVRFSANFQGDVEMYAVPQNHIQRLRIHTDLDAQYKDATLQLWLKFPKAEQGSLKLSLVDTDGKRLATSPASIKLPADMDEFKYDFAVKNPKKWDSEHPNLYKLTLTLTDASGKVTETITKNVGFRKLERRGKKVYVNGQEVKFKGIWGPDDAKQMRELNVNHVRHKYMTEAILDSCDVYGIYVLHENSVDFAKFRGGQSPEYEQQWLDLLADMMERDYSHPSVVMWGLGNESFHGDFTLRTHKYAKFDDPDRQTMFSWANRISPDEEIPYDIYSYHYAPMGEPDVDLSSYGVSLWHSPSLLLNRKDAPEMPVLVDESTHVVISTEEAGRDPNVRNFWGESIKKSWELVWNTEGALGLDQFGMFNDMDEWEMPEQWLMRKAYSPFVIEKTRYDNPGTGKPLAIEVENRFLHTNLKEVTIEWKNGDMTGSVKGPDIMPRGKGTFYIPCKQFNDGDILELAVKRADGYQVDEYRLEIAPEPARIPALSDTPPSVSEDNGYIYVKGKDFVLTYDRYAGQITDINFKGETVMTGGPHLQLLRSGLSTGEYWPQSTKVSIEGSEAVIDMDVIYSPIAAAFQIRIDNNGLMTVHYTIKRIPDPAPRSFTIPWSSADKGGYSEVGLVFTLPGSVDRLTWDRKGLWTTYPENHVGRNHGTAWKSPEGLDQKEWKNLTYDFNWMGGSLARSTVPNDFRASKEYFSKADVLLKDSSIGVEALSEEKDAIRLAVSHRGGEVTMYINNLWNYPTLGVGNWMKPAVIVNEGYSNTVYLRLIDLEEE